MNQYSRFLWRLLKINLADTADRNAWYLVVEMFWASILSSIATFNAAYAIRLGADNMQVSLLSSIPALMAVLVSYPAGLFMQRKPRRKPWVLGSLMIYRAGFLLVALAPWLKLAGIEPGLMSVLILVAISAPAHFFNVGWIPMLAEIIPENRRAALFAARNITNQATISITVFLCGQWLDRVIFPINYQVMYVVGFVTSLLSMYCLVKLHVPDSPAAAVGDPQDQAAGQLPAAIEPRGAKGSRLGRIAGTAARELKGMWTSTLTHPPFMRITMNTFLHGVGVWMAAPLYALYYVRQLDASDAWLGLNGTIASIGTIAGFSLWRWLMVRWGEPVSLKRTIALVGVYPLLIGLTPNLELILVYGVINGLIVPGVNLSHFNILLKVTPPDDRPRFTAIYMTVMNAGAFISPLISVAIAQWVGLAPMLVISGLLSVIGSTAFWWNPVVKEDKGALEAAAA